MRLMGLFNNREEFRAQQDELSGASVGKAIQSFLTDVFTGLTNFQEKRTPKKAGISSAFLSMLTDGDDAKRLAELKKLIAEAKEEAQKVLDEAETKIMYTNARLKEIHASGGALYAAELEINEVPTTFDDMCDVNESFNDSFLSASNPEIGPLQAQLEQSCETRDGVIIIMSKIENLEATASLENTAKIAKDLKTVNKGVRKLERPNAVSTRFDNVAMKPAELNRTEIQSVDRALS